MEQSVWNELPTSGRVASTPTSPAPDSRWLHSGVFEYAPKHDCSSWVYVTSGMSTPWEDDEANRGAVSGLGCEFVLESSTQGDWAIRSCLQKRLFRSPIHSSIAGTRQRFFSIADAHESPRRVEHRSSMLDSDSTRHSQDGGRPRKAHSCRSAVRALEQGKAARTESPTLWTSASSSVSRRRCVCPKRSKYGSAAQVGLIC
jgi:hypothetical protein